VADTTEGDRTKIALICPRCFDPNYILIDKNPCYEISTGRYLKRSTTTHCPSCMENSGFVPEDETLSCWSWSQVRDGERLRRAREHVPVVETHEDIARLNSEQLRAWIESKNFKHKMKPSKPSLVELAGLLLKRVQDPKTPDIESRLRKFQVYTFKAPESHEDIASSTRPDLETWIASQKFKHKKNLPKQQLIALAGLLLDQLHAPGDSNVQSHLKVFQPRVSARKTREVQKPKFQQQPASFNTSRRWTAKSSYEYENIESRNQLQDLSVPALGKWMQLQGFVAGKGDRSAVLQKALRVWDS
jgi:hypothetical protein